MSLIDTALCDFCFTRYCNAWNGECKNSVLPPVKSNLSLMSYSFEVWW